MSTTSSEDEARDGPRNIRSSSLRFRDQDTDGSDESYEYKRQLGDLIFNAYFEAGNLAHVKRIDRHEYELMVRADISNGDHRLWFNFTVCNQAPKQSVIFSFVNLSDESKVFGLGLRPVVRSRSQPNWTNLRGDQVFYYRSKDHDNHYILSIAFKFLSHEDEHQFCLLNPCTVTSVNSFLTSCLIGMKRREIPVSGPGSLKTKQNRPSTIRAKSASSHIEGSPLGEWSIQFKTLGISPLCRSIDMISIGGPEDGEDLRQTPILVALCQSRGNIHSPATIVCLSALDFSLGENPIAFAIRQNCHLIFIPMLDPDSVHVGNTCTDLAGQTLCSRDLMHANKELYSPLLVLISHLRNLASSQRQIIVLDLMVDINLVGCRLVGTRYQDIRRMERHLEFPRQLSRFCDSFYIENCEFSHRNNSNSPFIDLIELNSVDYFMLQLSPSCFYRKSVQERSPEIYTKEKYISIGESLVYAALATLMSSGLKVPAEVENQLGKFNHNPREFNDFLLKVRLLR